MQRKQRMIGDQRFDLPQYDSMLGYIDAEFNAYNKAFLSPLNYISEGWKIASNGGLQVKVDQSTDSFLFNSEQAGKENILYRKSTEDVLLLTLTDNAVNYVELVITSEVCAEDTVALWDPTANGGQGQEFTQSSFTAYEQRPALRASTISFSGATNTFKLAIVTTSGGVISNISDQRVLLHHVESDWNFGANRTDKTIANYKDGFDALATAIKEIKDTAIWTDKPFAGTTTLKEFQNMFITGGGILEWEGTKGVSTLGWSASLYIEIANRPNNYEVSAGSYVMADGDALYIDVPTGVPVGPIVPVVLPLADVPINPTSVGYSPYIQVLFHRSGNKIYGSMDIPELDSGEQAEIGQDLPIGLRNRLGILTETTYENYTSTSVIGINDNYPTAISKLDSAIFAVQSEADSSASALAAVFDALGAILSGEPLEEHFDVVADQTIFDATIIKWQYGQDVADITVFMNGQKMTQDFTGGTTQAFRKNSETQIEFSAPILANARVTIRNTVPYLSKPYFVSYLDDTEGSTVTTQTIYATGGDRLGVYRNGTYLMRSLSLGVPAERYLEQSGIAVELGAPATDDDIFAFVHQSKPPTFKVFQTGLTGTVLTVPTYVTGSNRLRVYRNGLLLNKSGYGAPSDQYVETSSTSITLGVTAIAGDNFIFECIAVAPAWREDITTVTGLTLTFGSTYALGNKRLLVFRNGNLVYNSTTLGDPIANASDRYQEATTATVTLEVAAIAADVFTAIYQ